MPITKSLSNVFNFNFSNFFEKLYASLILPRFIRIELSGIKKADLSVIVKWRNNPDILKFNTQYFLLNMEQLNFPIIF